MTLEVDSLDLLDAVVLLRQSAARHEKAGDRAGAARHLSLARTFAQEFADHSLFSTLCLELGVRPSSRSSAARTADRIQRSLARATANAVTHSRTA